MSAAIFHAFGDESGIEPDQPWCLISGYMGAPEAWRSFRVRWKAVLNDFALEMSDFHAGDFFRRLPDGRKIPPYSDWSGKKAGAFLGRLVRTINDHNLYPIGCAVERAAFESLPVEWRRYFTGADVDDLSSSSAGKPNAPYLCALHQYMGEALIAADRTAGAGAAVHFVFDNQKRYERTVIGMLDTLRRQQATAIEMVGGVVFEDRRLNPELQAADLLTHTWYSGFARDFSLNVERTVALDGLAAKKSWMWRMDTAAFARVMQASGVTTP